MTISNLSSRTGHVALGGETTFTYGFEIFASTDLVVERNGTALVEGTDYTVAGVGNASGGTITLDGTQFPSGATVDDTWVLYRAVTKERLADYQTAGDFRAVTVNAELDKMIAITQEMQRDIDYGIKFPIEDALATGDNTMPAKASRLGKYLYFDAVTGLPSVAAAVDTSAVSSFMATVLDDTTAAEARTTLGAAGTTAASTTAAGIVELATELETAVGTDTTRAVTPNSLKGKLPWGASPGGTADAIEVTYSPALTSLPDGQLCFFRAAAANTSTTPTFNPNGLGASTIVKNGNQPLVAGDIAGQYHEIILRYEATNARWELLNPAVPAAAAAGRVKLVDNDWSTGTPSSVTFEDADGMDWSTYSYFEIELQGYISATCRLLCTFSQGGAYQTGGTDYFYANTGFRFTAGSSNGTSAINIPNIYNEIYKGSAQYNEMFHMRATLYPGLSDGTNICGPYIHWSFVSSAAPGGNRGHANGTGSLRNLVATEIDGIKFEQNTGNMPNGSFKVWGIV